LADEPRGALTTGRERGVLGARRPWRRKRCAFAGADRWAGRGTTTAPRCTRVDADGIDATVPTP
jgi:hypothetical protein